MTSPHQPTPMTIDLEAKLLEIERWREDIVTSRAQREKMFEETSKLRLEQTYLPKDYTLRVATLVGTLAGVSCSAITAILSFIYLHHG